MKLIGLAQSRLDGDVECRVGSATTTIDDHEVIVELCAELGGWFAELRDRVHGPDQWTKAAQISTSLVGIPAETWHLKPAHSGVAFHAHLTLSQIESANQPAPLTDEDRPAHIVLTKYLPQALAVGGAVRSLCGQVFSPTETGEQTHTRQVCPLCTVVVAIVTSMTESTA